MAGMVERAVRPVLEANHLDLVEINATLFAADGVHLPDLDAEAPDLDLLVDAPHKLDVASGQEAHEVTRPVQPPPPVVAPARTPTPRWDEVFWYSYCLVAGGDAPATLTPEALCGITAFAVRPVSERGVAASDACGATSWRSISTPWATECFLRVRRAAGGFHHLRRAAVASRTAPKPSPRRVEMLW